MRFKDLLQEVSAPSIESLSAQDFAEIYAEAWYRNWRREVKRLGDDYPKVKNISHLFDQLENEVHAAAIQSGHIGFLYECLKNGRITKKIASGQSGFDSPGKREPEVEFRGEKCASYQGGCYYNALDFMNRTERDDVELAYGLMVGERFLEGVYKSIESSLDSNNSNLNTGLTEHSFVLVNGNKIFDPTLPHSELKSETYAYETVPSSVWRKFPHDFEDKNYSANEFADYIEVELENHVGRAGIKKRIEEYHENFTSQKKHFSYSQS